MIEKSFTTKNIICSNYCIWDNNDKPYGNDETVELLNKLTEENTSKQYKLNNYITYAKELETENKLLKQALKETIEKNNNTDMIKIYDELFQLNYTDWYNKDNNRNYYDWEEKLLLKKLSEIYE